MMTTFVLVAAVGSTGAPDEVVVFPDRAQVTRRAPVSCGQRTAIVFEQVPPSAVGDSFRARMSEGTVDGLRAELVKQEKVFGEKAQALEKRLEELGDERRRLDDQVLRAETQAAMASKLRSVTEQGLSRELAAEKPDVKAWQAALEVPLTGQLQVAKQVAELETKRRQLDRVVQDVQRQLDEARAGGQRESYRVEVLVTCPAGKPATVSLGYLVGGASWTPAYEARANEAAKTVELATWATVTQTTGEDWAGVKLVLSTAVPSENATPPTMNTLLLGATERVETKKVLTRREEFVDSASVAQSAPPPEPARGLVAKNQGLSVQLEVKDAAKVPGDGAAVRVFVGEATLAATFELRVMPRLMPVAFRVAELSNTGGWPLLAGQVDAFRPTGLVGRYPLERVAQGAAFTLTFGIEDAIRVKRTVVEELKKDAGVFNSKKRFLSSYRIDVANYGKQPTDVTVAEQVPVAEVNDIDIGLTEKTSAGVQLDKATGVARWKVPLKPQEKKTLDFGYRVDVPTTYDLGGL